MLTSQIPQQLFGTAAFGYTGAMVLSTEALKYVNFPTKVLGKSCKVRSDPENMKKMGLERVVPSRSLHEHMRSTRVPKYVE